MTGRRIKLEELFRIGSSKRVLQTQWTSYGVPFYRGREITRLAEDGFVDNELFISEELFSECRSKNGAPQAGDIMVTAIGTIGNSYVVRSDDRFYFKDASVLWLDRTADISSEFINYWLKSPLFLDQLDRGNGATVDTLTIQKLQSVEVNVPSHSEQFRLVTILDEAFEGIATAKANAEKNLRNAREVFSGEIERIFSSPEISWRVVALSDIGRTQTGSTPKSAEPENLGVDVPFVKPGDFNRDGSINYDNDGLSETGAKKARLIEAGSALMVCIGATIGKAGYAERQIATNQQVNSWTPFSDVLPKFIYYQMTSKDFQRRVVEGSGQATLPIINKSKWSSLRVAVPSTVNAQSKIVSDLDRLLEESMNLEVIYKRKLVALTELKKSLLHRAFTGEL